jgi:YD repeat-containing protein
MLTNSNQDTLNVLTTIMSYSYDNVGNVLSMTDAIAGNLGVTTTHEYDALNRLTVNAHITHSKGANVISSYAQTYDAGSKITGVTVDGSSTYT